MRKNTKITLVIIAIIIVLGVISFVLIKQKNNQEYVPDNVIITQYKAGSDIELKNINVYDTNDLNKLSDYIKRLSPLKDSEMIKLALLQEIVIEYGDFISVGIQLGETQYCYYTNKEENISSLSKMPNGLYEWVIEKLNS